MTTDYGHPERAFFQKLETFGLGHTNWAEILWGIWGISGQTISTILALWVPCLWKNVAGSLSYKNLWFLGLKHITPKCSQNKILAVKNLGNSVHTSVFGAYDCLAYVSVSKGIYGLLKKWIKLTVLSIFSSQDSEFRSFFGRIEGTIICFCPILMETWLSTQAIQSYANELKFNQKTIWLHHSFLAKICAL